VRSGDIHRVFTATPLAQRGLLAGIVTGSFTSALNEILLVAAIISFASGVLAFILIRAKDFASYTQPDQAAAPGGPLAQAQHRPAALAAAEPRDHEDP
jgi:hypothetical protein